MIRPLPERDPQVYGSNSDAAIWLIIALGVLAFFLALMLR